ncbi:MAG TPA: exopolyphosphatase [Pseudorhodoplanes sp.]|jgi:exopolyphosphatase/guanosine-5'-triphosphate,3'-diphosphate pyrophosphatase|nr:exopolyphosphatase [Pseudorhodoplanes sp.]
MPRGLKGAQGRLDHGPPVAVVDIGSNSVRLVVYEGLARSPTPIFNEKVLAGLGREVQSTGLLAADAVDTALRALRRFRALCDTLQVKRVLGLATAACRDARNGKEFIAEAERICRTRIDVLSGRREAHLAALGVVSGIYKPDGIVGDLGGGSLELTDVYGGHVGAGITLPLGGLALQDASGKSIKKATKIVERALAQAPALSAGKGRHFYAVGGAWRALASLHMAQTGYPLHVMHGYTIRAREAIEFCELVHRVNPESLSRIEVVASARRPLLGYAALVLEHVIRRAKPESVVISALGVREGLLYSLLPESERKRDALIAAAQDINILRSRSPRHGEELVGWTDRLMSSSGLDEKAEERRLRHAACYLADIAWRTHPDYRGDQSLNIISHADFVAVDHPGRAYIALAIFFRHVGVTSEDISPRLRELASSRVLDRARVLGAAMRVAYMISASMPGVLPNAPLQVEKGKLVLRLKGRLAALAGERVSTRMRQLGRLIGREPEILT